MNRLTKAIAAQLIKQELGLPTRNMEQINENRDYPHFVLIIGNMRVEVYKVFDYEDIVELNIFDVDGAGHITKLFTLPSLKFDYDITMEYRRSDLEEAASEFSASILRYLLSNAI